MPEKSLKEFARGSRQGLRILGRNIVGKGIWYLILTVCAIAIVWGIWSYTTSVITAPFRSAYETVANTPSYLWCKTKRQFGGCKTEAELAEEARLKKAAEAEKRRQEAAKRRLAAEEVRRNATAERQRQAAAAKTPTEEQSTFCQYSLGLCDIKIGW